MGQSSKANTVRLAAEIERPLLQVPLVCHPLWDRPHAAAVLAFHLAAFLSLWAAVRGFVHGCVEENKLTSFVWELNSHGFDRRVSGVLNTHGFDRPVSGVFGDGKPMIASSLSPVASTTFAFLFSCSLNCPFLRWSVMETIFVKRSAQIATK